MSETEDLSFAQKEQIRKYMLGIIVAPAALFGIGGIILGWFVNSGIMGSSYAKAYSDAQGDILALATSAATSAKEAELAATSASETLSSLREGEAKLAASQELISEIVSQAKANYKVLEAISDAESSLATSVASALLANPEKFSLSVSGDIGSRVEQLENELDERFRFLPSDSYKGLWSASDGPGPKLENLSDVVPTSATAVILNVIVVSNKGGTGSFVCSGPDGSHAKNLSHYRNVSVTEYAGSWSGGTVICPLTQTGTFTWGLYDNDSKEATSADVSSYGTLVGWL